MYFAAAVGVVMSADGKRQTYHQGHDDDVMSLTMSADRTLCATGQMGKAPSVRVWDAATGAHVATLGGFHKRGVPAVAFSACGTLSKREGCVVRRGACGVYRGEKYYSSSVPIDG